MMHGYLLVFIGIYLLSTVLIGCWASSKVKTTRDFVIAVRRLPTSLAACALFATWFGSETILGATAEFAENGVLGIIEDPFGAALCLVLVGLIYARPLYRLNILTFNDFFKMRFGRTAEITSAVFMIPSYFGWIAAQLVALAIVLKTIVGIPLIYGIILCTVVVVFYTYFGGMWAVSITDAVQSIMIIIGLLLLAYSLSNQAGGIQVVLDAQPKGFFRFLPEAKPMAVMEYFAAWITIGLGSIPQQDVFQRVMAAKSENTAVKAGVIAGLMYLTVGLIPLFIGLCANYLYPSSNLSDTQMIIPIIVLEHGSLFLQIVFFGALLSAILSTTSGAILAPATVIGENILRPMLRNNSDKLMLHTMRLSVVGVAICAAFLATSKSNIYELVGMSSALSLVALFFPLTAGLFWKSTSRIGAILSMISGLFAWILAEFVLHSQIPSILVGGGMSLFFIILGSLVFPDDSHKLFLENSKQVTN
ncbi:MAG: sodium:solute symporter family protein [Bacteroidota bacterium]